MASPTRRPDELSTLLGRWSTGSGTLVEDLSAALTAAIDEGLLPAGVLLPPQRGLAAALGVSRGVVTSAYAVLEGRGYLVSVQGSGSRVTSAQGQVHARTGGRLLSFTRAPGDVIDLSTGALPASRVASDVIAGDGTGGGAGDVGGQARSYLGTDGYFPAGLPVLRQAIADQLTRDGIPTGADQVLVTAGAQQATWLVITALVGSGDVVLVEEPTYRGALEVMRGQGAQVQGVRMRGGAIDAEQVRRAERRQPALLYCQTAIHNPTGQTTTAAARRSLAEAVNGAGLVTVEDRSMSDLTLTGPAVLPSLAGQVDPELHLTIGSLSKLFWGGLRVGWVRAAPARIKALNEIRKPVDLGCSVIDQLLGVAMLQHTETARLERRTMLAAALASTEAELASALPHWTWEPIAGGSGLWVDTGADVVALTERAKRVGVELAPGPGFSAHGGQRTMLRLPVWHQQERLHEALALIAPLSVPDRSLSGGLQT